MPALKCWKRILTFTILLAIGFGLLFTGLVRAFTLTPRAYVPLIYYEITRTPTKTPTRTPTPTSTPTPTPTDTPASNKPPPYSTSFYMNTKNPQVYYNIGCDHGKRDKNLAGIQDSIIVLDFGMPTDDDDGYGANMFGYGPILLNEIEVVVEEVAVGYLACVGSDTTSHLRIGVGTNNYMTSARIATFNYYMHARYWAKMVNNINTWLKAEGFFSRVDAAGASDLELGWNTPTNTRAWVDGYDSSNSYPFYDYGDAQGCPTRDYPHWSCDPEPWSQEDLWYVSFGVGPAYPLPLIYATNGVNAEQWALLSLYAYQTHGVRMDIKGAFTQWQACQQYPGGCGDYLDNTPAQGWTQMYNELNRDPRTAQTLRWSTDIKWK